MLGHPPGSFYQLESKLNEDDLPEMDDSSHPCPPADPPGVFTDQDDAHGLLLDELPEERSHRGRWDP